jgi:hypothetical protein
MVYKIAEGPDVDQIDKEDPLHSGAGCSYNVEGVVVVCVCLIVSENQYDLALQYKDITRCTCSVRPSDRP